MAFLNSIKRLWQRRQELRHSEHQARCHAQRRSLYRLETLESRLLLAGDVLLTPIALEGMAAPGTDAGVLFAGFESPVIDDMGHVFSQAYLSGPYGVEVPNNIGLWVKTDEGFDKLLRIGDALPGTSGQFVNFGNLIAAGDGKYVFLVTLTGDTATDSAIYRGQADVQGIQPVVTSGLFGNLLLNSAGDVAYHTGIQSLSGWVNSTLVNRELDPAQDVPPGQLLWAGGGVQFLNDNGDVAFLNSIIFPQSDFRHITGIWTGAPDSLELDPVISSPDPVNPQNPIPPSTIAPGTNVKFSLNGFTLLGFNNAGQIAIGGIVNLSRPSGFFQELRGVWAGDPSNLQLVALETKPGADPDTTIVFGDPVSLEFPPDFLGFQDVLLNGQGQVVFRSEMNGPGITNANNEGIWITEGGALKRIVREGDPAPNVPGSPNASFTGIGSVWAINNVGQVVFTSGIRLDNQIAVDSLWMYDPQANELFLLLRGGQLIDVNGTARGFNSWRMVGGSGEGGRATAFSDTGVLAIKLEFPDFGYPPFDVGSGIFTVQVVPEPPESNTYIWAGGLNNQWWSDTGDFTNWVDENGKRHKDPPGKEGDELVFIDNANVVLSHPNGQEEITNVKSITATGSLQVNTPLILFGGDSPSFGVLDINANLYELSLGNVVISGALELNNGTLNTGTGGITFQGTADATLSGGLWKIGDGGINSDGGGDNVLEFRGGRLEKIGTGLAEIAIPIDTQAGEPPTPVIRVLEGSLKLAAGGLHKATISEFSNALVYEAVAGSTLILSGHSNFQGRFSIGGSGIVTTDSSTQWNIPLAHTMIVRSSGSGRFEFAGGTIDAEGPIELNGENQWLAGEFTGGSINNLLIVTGGVRSLTNLKVLSEGDKTITGVFWNKGNLVQQANIALVGGTVLNTDVWNLQQGDLQATDEDVFYNSGSLFKSGDAGTESIVNADVYQTNGGRLHVQFGGLVLRGDNVFSGGEAIIDHTAKLNLRRGKTRIENTVNVQAGGELRVSGDVAQGVLRISSGATLNLNEKEGEGGLLTVEDGQLLVGGTLTNDWIVSLKQNANVDIVSSGTLVNETGGFVVVNGAKVNVLGQIENHGTMNLLQSPQFQIDGGKLENAKGGTVDHRSDFTLDLIETLPAQIINNGTYRLAGVIRHQGSVLGLVFNNTDGIITLDRPNGEVRIGLRFLSSGTVRVLGETTVVIEKASNLQGNNTLSGGKWFVENGATLNLHSEFQPQVPAITAIAKGTIVTLSDNGRLNNLPLTTPLANAQPFTISGTLDLLDGALWREGPVKVESEGTLSIISGSEMRYDYDNRLLPNDVPAGFVADDFARVVVSGILSVKDTSGTNNYGEVFFGKYAQLQGTGFVNGRTIVDGKLSPGKSPGTFTFESDLTLGETAILELEAGSGDGGEADLLRVLGNLELGGELQFAFIDGFAPTAGQTFTFIDVDGEITGAFDSTRIVGLDSGFQFEAGFDEMGMLTLTALGDGISLPAAFRGIVFDDQDGDGLFDTGEPGRDGLTVHLQPILSDGNLGDEATTTTDADGQFSFADLAAGDYRVSVDPVPGTLATTLLKTDVEAQNGVILVGFEGQAALPDGDPHLEEVETTLAFGSALMDFGDAPDPSYPTLFDFDGARHTLMPGLHLGGAVDSEEDGEPSDDASADAGDDGISLSLLQLGKIGQATINVGLPGGITEAKLDAWIDWNSDGDWDDANERIAESVTVVGGDNVLNIDVPSDASAGLTFARFRLSKEGTLEPTGLAGAGEVEDYQIEVKPRSTTIGTGANKAFIYTDIDGTITTITLKGGTATVIFSGDNLQEQVGSKGVTVTGQNIEIVEIAMADTTASSSLTFKTSGGDGFSSVGKISGDDPLGKLTAKGINLVGEGVVMTGDGYINTIDIHSTQNGADLILPETQSTGITVKAGSLGAGTDIQLGSGLKSLTATQWGGSPSAPLRTSALIAPWASKITINGDMGVDLNLSGAGNLASTLGTLTVKGNVQGGEWNIIGNIGKVNVTGVMEDVKMRTTGNVTSLSTGALRYSTIFAGVKDIEDLPTSLNDFEVAVEIKALTIKGISGSTEPSFVDSRISARNLGKVSLNDTKADNKGIPFGFAADKITSYARDNTKLSKLDAADELDEEGDYIVRVL